MLTYLQDSIYPQDLLDNDLKIVVESGKLFLYHEGKKAMVRIDKSNVGKYITLNDNQTIDDLVDLVNKKHMAWGYWTSLMKERGIKVSQQLDYFYKHKINLKEKIGGGYSFDFYQDSATVSLVIEDDECIRHSETLYCFVNNNMIDKIAEGKSHDMIRKVGNYHEKTFNTVLSDLHNSAKLLVKLPKDTVVLDESQEKIIDKLSHDLEVNDNMLRFLISHAAGLDPKKYAVGYDVLAECKTLIKSYHEKCHAVTKKLHAITGNKYNWWCAEDYKP